MDIENPNDVPMAQSAPPVEPSVPFGSPVPSSWPRPIGIVCLVFGVLGILGGLFAIVAAIVGPKIANAFAEMGRAGMVPDQMQDHMVWAISSAGIGFCLAVVLCIAGIGIIRRRPSGIRRAKAWAWLRMVFAVAEAVFGYGIQVEAFEAMRHQDPGTFSTLPPMFGPWVAVFTSGLTVIWGCALPLFLLIWFKRKRISEDVATWN